MEEERYNGCLLMGDQGMVSTRGWLSQPVCSIRWNLQVGFNAAEGMDLPQSKSKLPPSLSFIWTDSKGVVQIEGLSSLLNRLKVVLSTSNDSVKEIIPQMHKLLGFVT